MHTEYKVTPDGRVVEFKTIPVFRLSGIADISGNVYELFNQWRHTPEGEFVEKNMIEPFKVHSFREPVYLTYSFAVVATMPATAITEMYLKFPKEQL